MVLGFLLFGWLGMAVGKAQGSDPGIVDPQILIGILQKLEASGKEYADKANSKEEMDRSLAHPIVDLSPLSSLLTNPLSSSPSPFPSPPSLSSPSTPSPPQNLLIGLDNKIDGLHNSVFGNTNHIIGFYNSLQGSNNLLTGQANNIWGVSNKVVGVENSIAGDNNRGMGEENKLVGEGNWVVGVKNMALGDGNSLIGEGNWVVWGGNRVQGGRNQVGAGGGRGLAERLSINLPNQNLSNKSHPLQPVYPKIPATNPHPNLCQLIISIPKIPPSSQSHRLVWTTTNTNSQQQLQNQGYQYIKLADGRTAIIINQPNPAPTLHLPPSSNNNINPVDKMAKPMGFSLISSLRAPPNEGSYGRRVVEELNRKIEGNRLVGILKKEG